MDPNQQPAKQPEPAPGSIPHPPLPNQPAIPHQPVAPPPPPQQPVNPPPGGIPPNPGLNQPIFPQPVGQPSVPPQPPIHQPPWGVPPPQPGSGKQMPNYGGPPLKGPSRKGLWLGIAIGLTLVTAAVISVFIFLNQDDSSSTTGTASESDEKSAAQQTSDGNQTKASFADAERLMADLGLECETDNQRNVYAKLLSQVKEELSEEEAQEYQTFVDTLENRGLLDYDYLNCRGDLEVTIEGEERTYPVAIKVSKFADWRALKDALNELAPNPTDRTERIVIGDDMYNDGRGGPLNPGFLEALKSKDIIYEFK